MTLYSRTHEVYNAPICVPVCKWYINCNNRQLANSSTTLDKQGFFFLHLTSTPGHHDLQDCLHETHTRK